MVLNAEVQPRIIGGVESSESNWSYASALMHRYLGVSVNGDEFEAYFMTGVPAQLFNGTLVNCDKAFTECDGVEERICLIARGISTFAEKTRNCALGGGIGAIIYNNVEGEYFGTMGHEVSSIPVVSTDRASGLALLNYLDRDVSFGYVDIAPSSSFCGASYIGGKWLVTAAHCVVNSDEDAIIVNVGGHDLEKDTENVISVSRILIHEDYDTNNVEYDIALIELSKEPIGVDKVELATNEILNDAIAEFSTVIELGRGQQSPVDPNRKDTPIRSTPSELFEVEVNLITNEQCDAAVTQYYASIGSSQTGLVTKDMVCAGTSEGTTGTCFGDSGGPLILQQNGKDYLLGTTSWGIGCAVPGLYDAFSRVPYFKESIDKVISGESGKFKSLDIVNEISEPILENGGEVGEANDSDNGESNQPNGSDGNKTFQLAESWQFLLLFSTLLIFRMTRLFR